MVDVDFENKMTVFAEDLCMCNTGMYSVALLIAQTELATLKKSAALETTLEPCLRFPNICTQTTRICQQKTKSTTRVLMKNSTVLKTTHWW